MATILIAYDISDRREAEQLHEFFKENLEPNVLDQIERDVQRNTKRGTPQRVVEHLYREELDSAHRICVHMVRTADEAYRIGGRSDHLVVLWSDNSIASPFIYELARSVAAYNTTHVSLGAITLNEIPIILRPETLISFLNPEIIVDVVSLRLREKLRAPDLMFSLAAPHLSEEETDALKREATAKAAARVRAEAALAIEDGKLVHNIPETMVVNLPEAIEVRLGRAEAQGLMMGLVGAGALAQENLPIVETMTLELHADRRMFVIERQTRRTQLVKSDLIRGTALSNYEFGRWLWQVTPKRAGQSELYLTVSANVLDSQGIPASASLPSRTFTVKVKVNYGQLSISGAKWAGTGLAGMLVAGLVGAYTQDVWWPAVKSWAKSISWEPPTSRH